MFTDTDRVIDAEGGEDLYLKGMQKVAAIFVAICTPNAKTAMILDGMDASQIKAVERCVGSGLEVAHRLILERKDGQ